MNKLTAALIAVLIAIFTGLAWLAFHYHGQSVEKDKTITTVTGERDNAFADIRTMETQRQAVAAIDIKYTKELADAKSENERLRADIANGSKRLQLNATCTKPVSKTSGPASVPDDASPRYDGEFERNYLSLRERIGIATKQIEGLQAYINNVCLMPAK
ncbi:putative prophage endopeptidase [Yersinia rohdei]|uniref:lysis protein n=1 Tax=Yersinia rohdei TaxID=29485 RepID=UPI00061C29E5|nr:lysis protein [Yersinia rohdei]CNF10343.1 putative prophage endopeptidase [Yersinia rohdei]